MPAQEHIIRDMMIKGIILDYGGVLIDDTDAPAYRQISKLFNRDYASVQSAVEEALPNLQTSKINEKEFWARVFEKLGIRKDASGFERFWIESYKKNLHSKEGMESLVERLKAAGYKLGVLSNTEPSHAEFNWKRGAFINFDAVVLSCEVGMRKPDDRTYRMALGKIDLKPEECVFIDDKKEYLIPARKIGLKTILFRNPSQLEKDLKALGVDF
jgi:putative hydrolase of the HAD superfamily